MSVSARRMTRPAFTLLFAMALRMSKVEESVKLSLLVEEMSPREWSNNRDASRAPMLPPKKPSSRCLLSFVFLPLGGVLDGTDQVECTDRRGRNDRRTRPAMTALKKHSTAVLTDSFR